MLLDDSTGAHGTPASKMIQPPSTGAGHLHLRGLASRRTLCTSHTCLWYSQSRYFENGPIWNEVLAELRCFQLLLLFSYGGYLGILANSKAMPACMVGRWHTVSGRARQLNWLLELVKGVAFDGSELILLAGRHGLRLCWK